MTNVLTRPIGIEPRQFKGHAGYDWRYYLHDDKA